MRTPRQYIIVRAIIRALGQCGSYLCPETALLESVELMVTAPPLTPSEFDAALRDVAAERLVIDGEGPIGRTWKITEAGRVWAKEHRA